MNDFCKGDLNHYAFTFILTFVWYQIMKVNCKFADEAVTILKNALQHIHLKDLCNTQ